MHALNRGKKPEKPEKMNAKTQGEHVKHSKCFFLDSLSVIANFVFALINKKWRIKFV